MWLQQVPGGVAGAGDAGWAAAEFLPGDPLGGRPELLTDGSG